MSRHGWHRTLRIGVLIAIMAWLGLPGPVVAGPGDRAMYFEGRGQALIYPFWTVENTHTLFEIVNGITRVSSSSQDGFNVGASRNARWVLVLVTIRDTASEDVLNFTVCLSPGDVWPAALTLDGNTTVLLTADESTGIGSPAPLDPVGTINPTRGYIEAVMVDNGLTRATGCNGSHADSDFSSGSDVDGTDQPLFGRAIYVAAVTGMVTGFNAEAIKDLDEDLELRSGTLQGSTKAFQALAMGKAADSIVGSLLGRWVVEPTIGADTQVVVTFPLGSQSFNLCGGEAATPFGAFAAPCTTTSPLDFSLPATAALRLRDDAEGLKLSAQVPLGNEVNVITFSDIPNILERIGSGNAGWFRLMIDHNGDEVTDFVTGQLQTAGPDPTTVRLPHALPIVGFTIISVEIPAGRTSVIFPFHTEQPASLSDCATGIGFACN